jgi:hypothetical protein
MKSNSRHILLHTIGCIGFLAIPLLISPDITKGFDIFRVGPFRRDLVFFALLLLFFYAAYYYLIPKFYFTRKYAVFILAALGAFAVMYFVASLFEMHHPGPPRGGMAGMPPPPQQHGPPPGMRPGHFLIRFAGYSLFPFLIVFVSALLLRIRSRLQEYEKEKNRAELSYLKAQINPHFLFNSLNSIYALALEKSDLAPEAVLKLSGMMRYVLNDAKQEFVPLEKEIAYITDYVALQEIRLGDTATIKYTVTGNTLGSKIAPMLVIPFVENAFKYGVNPEQKSEIGIGVNTSDGVFHMHVINHKVKTLSYPEEKNEIGLENTKQRLQLVYPGRHTLQLNETEETFEVKLQIQL